MFLHSELHIFILDQAKNMFLEMLVNQYPILNKYFVARV